MARPPDAFLSYTRFDEQHGDGAISQFRDRLASAVRAVAGEPFEIFQDVDGIGLGKHWPTTLERMLDQARFFIPILTPSYFTSKANGNGSSPRGRSIGCGLPIRRRSGVIW